MSRGGALCWPGPRQGLAHTIQGILSDPFYGENANFIGWDLIGYPGTRMGVSNHFRGFAGSRLRVLVTGSTMIPASFLHADPQTLVNEIAKHVRVDISKVKYV